MNVLVTGSNGLIGSWIVKELKRNYNIIGCGTKKETLSDVDCYVRWNIGYEDIPEELLDIEIDVIVHAASSKSIDDNDLELSFVNLVGVHRIINLCKVKKCKIAILVSSIPIIGNPNNKAVHETNEFNPPTMYHATKAAQELMFHQLEKTGVRVVCLRVPSPIAPIMDGKTIFTIFIENALQNKDIVVNGNGTRKQNYIDVRDIAHAVDKIICSSKAQGIYNIGSDITISNVELAKKCIEIAKSKSLIAYSGNVDSADNQVWDIDTRRLKEDTGFKQKFTIEQTIAEYIKNAKELF